jgi:hypothetical protein
MTIYVLTDEQKNTLRAASEKAEELGGVENFMRGIVARNNFNGLATPTVVLALLDELETQKKLILELSGQPVDSTKGN